MNNFILCFRFGLWASITPADVFDLGGQIQTGCRFPKESLLSVGVKGVWIARVLILRLYPREGRLTEEQALFIIKEAAKLLKEEPNLLEVEAPITGSTDFL